MSEEHSMQVLYGFLEPDIDQAKARLDPAIRVSWAARESFYLGGAYFSGSDAHGNSFMLRNNFGECGDDWAEPDFQRFASLLYVSYCTAFEPIEAVITAEAVGAKLLRRTTG